jgi:hypothetical protein
MLLYVLHSNLETKSLCNILTSRNLSIPRSQRAVIKENQAGILLVSCLFPAWASKRQAREKQERGDKIKEGKGGRIP